MARERGSHAPPFDASLSSCRLESPLRIWLHNDHVKTLDSCYPLGYNCPVVASFAHKGLERFYRTGTVSGIQAIHAAKLRLILSLLDAAQTVEGMRLSALKLHKLKGARNDTWAVTVQANWRVTFRFENGNAHIVNYEDYH